MALAYDRRSGRVLVFDSVSVVRRVRSHPADWHSLPGRDLQAVAASR